MKHLQNSGISFALCLSFIFCTSASAQTPFYVTALDSAQSQLARLTASAGTANKFARTINTNGTVKTVAFSDWTSGFFPGCMWLMYDYTQDTAWKSRAMRWTAALDSVKYITTTHDVGFILYCSYGNGLRSVSQSDKTKYEAVLLKGSQSLCTRYRATVKAIRSWDWMAGFPVIIDNMMNLEMLCHASKAGGDSTYIKIAIAHANTTKKNHFRPNYSSFHVVNYDSVTGAVTARQTYQGYADSSSWARGQAWGLYGYTFMYRETGDTAYLNHARHIADYILNHPRLPVDLVPYWDYDAPASSNPPRDASAAAVTASALIELSTLMNNAAGAGYLQKARTMLTSLASSAYCAAPNTNGNFILKHSTGNLPAGAEIDVPLIYADYYFLEALLRLRALETSKSGQAPPADARLMPTHEYLQPLACQGMFRIHPASLHSAGIVVKVYAANGRRVRKDLMGAGRDVLDLKALPHGCYTVDAQAGGSPRILQRIYR